jgi:zinc/manganese transport system ATP-binding protein
LSALTFDKVTIRLGGRNILSAASFVIEEGEFVGMLGANGAGKTTLMRAALGLVSVSSGAIAVLGRPRRAAILRSATCRKIVVRSQA